MNNEEKIISTLDLVVEKVSNLETRFDSLEMRFGGLEGEFVGLKTRFGGLETRFDRLEENQDMMAVELVGMKEYMSTELATKSELHEVENRLTGHIEGLAKSHERHDMEICALNSRVTRVEGHIFGA
jgi:predicted nuclease with TOPRIM domain